MEERKIIHIDMDAFFAAVEQRDNPELRGKPVAVGFDGPRGVVSTASYEARKYGVHSAQSIAQAKQRCPNLIIVPCRHDYYTEISHQIHQIFQKYTDLIEPISIDEAFLDVTQNKKGIELAVDIAKEIKARIKETTGLTASAGISYCKFLAKVASDYRKPDGICTIHPDKALDFIAQLPVEDFWGVGKKTLQKMHFMGIFNGGDLRKVSEEHLVEVFGKAGHIFYDFARGIDNRPVITSRVRKSVGCEQTFLVVAVTNFPKHDFNRCKSATCKFLSRAQNQRGTKTGQNHGKIKSRTLCPKYPLWNTSVSFAKVQICPLKNEGKSLFLSFTTHFPTIVPQMWLLQTVLTSNGLVCENWVLNFVLHSVGHFQKRELAIEPKICHPYCPILGFVNV